MILIEIKGGIPSFYTDGEGSAEVIVKDYDAAEAGRDLHNDDQGTYNLYGTEPVYSPSKIKSLPQVKEWD